MNLVSEVEQQYYDVLKILIDPELEGLKSRIQVLPHTRRSSIPTSLNTSTRRKTKSGSAK